MWVCALICIHKTTFNHGNARLPELNLIAAALPYSSYRRPGVKMVARLIIPNTRSIQRRGLSAGWRGGIRISSSRRISQVRATFPGYSSFPTLPGTSDEIITG